MSISKIVNVKFVVAMYLSKSQSPSSLVRYKNGEYMMYAKVHKNTVLVYPYTWENLKSENPFTAYDNRFTISEWYSKTEEALVGDKNIVEVLEKDPPDYDSATQKIEKNAQPISIFNNWYITWEIISLSKEEIAAYSKVLILT